MRSAQGVISLRSISSAGPEFAAAAPVAAAETVRADFEAAQRFLERFLERAADGHDFADALHLRGQRRVGLREFLEGEPREFSRRRNQSSARSWPAWSW